MYGTIKEVYEDYMSWKSQDAARENISFEDYLRTEVC